MAKQHADRFNSKHFQYEGKGRAHHAWNKRQRQQGRYLARIAPLELIRADVEDNRIEDESRNTDAEYSLLCEGEGLDRHNMPRNERDFGSPIWEETDAEFLASWFERDSEDGLIDWAKFDAWRQTHMSLAEYEEGGYGRGELS